VAAVVQGTLTSRAPRYTIILELDRKVRDMELPAYAQGAPPHGVGLAQTMSHFMPTNYRELSESYFLFFSCGFVSLPPFVSFFLELESFFFFNLFLNFLIGILTCYPSATVHPSVLLCPCNLEPST